MNRYYLEQLSTHPDLMNAEVLDVLRELSEVATLAVVSNGVHKVQTRRVQLHGGCVHLREAGLREARCTHL